MNAKETKGEMYGLGVRVIPALHRIELLYEVDDMAEKDDGTPCPAGLSIGANVRKNDPLKTLAEYEALAKKLQIEGVGMGIDPAKMHCITWSQYKEKGYHEE